MLKKYHTYLKLEKGLSDNSVKAYELDLQRLQRYMDMHDIDIVHATLDDCKLFYMIQPERLVRCVPKLD
jgi:integrase/recombinase XerD